MEFIFDGWSCRLCGGSFTGFRLLVKSVQLAEGRREKLLCRFPQLFDLLFDNHINVPVPKYTTLWNSSLMAGLVGCAVVDIHSSFTGFRLLAAACQKRSIGGRKTGKFAHVRSDSCHVQMTP